MKRFLIFFLFVIILIISGYFSVGSNVPILKSIKNIIPKEFKNKLKSTIFLSRYKTKETIYIIRSNSPNSFELEKNSKIYIYSNLAIESPIKLNIYGYNLTKKISCLNTEFKHNYLIEMNNLDERCNNSFYFQGKIKDYNGEQYFYFALNNKIKNNSKNLIVLPVTNFFDYSSNIWGISSATSKLNFIPFIKNSNGNFPIAKKVRWSEHTHDSIKNLIVHLDNFDFVYDYDLEFMDLNSYKNLFFLAHQEWIQESTLTKIFQFLKDGSNKNVLSVGAGNFLRIVNFEFVSDKILQFQFPDTKVNRSKYNLNPQAYYDTYNCKLENFFSTAEKMHINTSVSIRQRELNRPLGEILHPYKSSNSKHYFEDIICDTGIKVPLLTITKYGTSNFIQVNADNVGIYFNDIPKLKDKIIEYIK